MTLFGAHTGYIIAAYAICALVLGGITVASLVARALARRRLDGLERSRR